MAEAPLFVEINPLFDADFYRERYALPTLETTDLYRHYRHRGIAQRHDPNALFSTGWYLDRYGDVRLRNLDPLDHYLHAGADEGRDPGPDFSTWGYLLLNPDVRAARLNPLLHYLSHGRAEGRLPPNDAFLAQCLREPFAALFAARQASKGEAAASRGGCRPGSPARIARPLPADPSPGCAAAADAAAGRVIARRSPWRVRALARLFAADLAASFSAVRLLGTLPAAAEGPIVFFTNHPSRWDAALYHWLAVHCFPRHRGFAPMDHRHLASHPILERVGAFSSRPGGYGGASAFLRTAEGLLRERDAALFIAAEGRFSDVRHRPVRVMPGVAHLARRAPQATFVPLAIDYVFWNERRPNLLLHFGQPVSADRLRGASTATIAGRLGEDLGAAMSALAEAGLARRPDGFTPLLRGRGRLAALGEFIAPTRPSPAPRHEVSAKAPGAAQTMPNRLRPRPPQPPPVSVTDAPAPPAAAARRCS